MSTGIFAFNQDTGTSVESSLSTVMSDLETALSDLDVFVVKVRADWDGDEMQLYDTIYQGWKKNAEQVGKILEGVHSAIGSVTTSVNDMRENVRKSFQEEG